MATATKKETAKKEFTLEQVFAMWKKTSKNGNTYFSGKLGGEWLTGFYNTNKKNPKEPDIRIYKQEDMEHEFVSLWCNATKNGKKILSGKLGDKKLVGFINAKASEKQPYSSVYYSDDAPKKAGTVKTDKDGFMDVPDSVADELPF